MQGRGLIKEQKKVWQSTMQERGRERRKVVEHCGVIMVEYKNETSDRKILQV